MLLTRCFPTQLAEHGLRKSGGAGRGRSGNGVARAGRWSLWGVAERDDGRASVNPDLFVMPVISIRKLVVESCRRLVGRRLKHGRMLPVSTRINTS